MKYSLFNPDTATTFWYVRDGMIYRQVRYPGDTDGHGDALGRTALAYILYDEAILFNAIIDRLSAQWPERYPGAPDTMSRDHLSMAIVALRLNNQKHKVPALDEFVKVLIERTGWRVSKRFWVTPDLWLWFRTQIYDWGWIHYLWQLIMLIQFLVVVPWNWFWRELTEELPEPWKRVTDKLLYPTYVLFGFAWQFILTKPSLLHKLLGFIARQDCLKENYTIRGLLGQKVPDEFVRNYQSRKSISCLWRPDDASRVPNEIGSPEEMAYNDLDGDLLKWVWGR